MTNRWTQRPAGSTWGDWGEDDELGRINLLTPAKVLEGVREVEAGISFCLSLPLDFPGGTALNQRRYPPVLTPTEDMKHVPDSFYNIHMSQMDEGGPRFVDVWADDQVTLSLQYSTQWDSLAHVGAEFDADGDGVEEPVYYNGYRAGVDLVGPKPDAAGDGGRHLLLRPPSGHGAHGLSGRAGAGRPGRPGPPPGPRLAGRGSARRSRRSWRRTTSWSNRATCSCSIPASPPRSSSGTATRIPVKIHTHVHVPRRTGPVAAGVDRRVADLRAGGGQLRRRGAGRAGIGTRAGIRCSRSTTSASSGSVSPSGRCGTCTSWPPGCASTTGAGSCSPRRRCGCPGPWAPR